MYIYYQHPIALNYCRHLHLHNGVQANEFLAHLQTVHRAPVQPHLISSVHALDSCGDVVHNGIHLFKTFLHPKASGLGMFIIAL